MIEIKNVSKKFADQFVLKDINLNIADGEQVLFVGQNGAGKSSLMRTILGEYIPTSGSVAIDGFDSFKQRSRALRGISFVPQTPPPDAAPPALEVRALTHTRAFRDVSFAVHPGEILGFFGLVGAGRSEVMNAVFGMLPAHGEVRLDDESVRIRHPPVGRSPVVSYMLVDDQLFQNRKFRALMRRGLEGDADAWGAGLLWVMAGSSIKAAFGDGLLTTYELFQIVPDPRAPPRRGRRRRRAFCGRRRIRCSKRAAWTPTPAAISFHRRGAFCTDGKRAHPFRRRYTLRKTQPEKIRARRCRKDRVFPVIRASKNPR